MGRSRSDNKKRKKVKRNTNISKEKEKDVEESSSQEIDSSSSSQQKKVSSGSLETADLTGGDSETLNPSDKDVEKKKKKEIKVVEKDVVEICERKGTCAALLYARAIRALRSIPEDAEFENPSSATDPLRMQIDACAAMLGRVYLVDEDAVIVTDEITELARAVSFTSDDVHELRQLFSLKNAVARAASGVQSAVLPPLGKPKFLEDIVGNPAYDVNAYEKRDIILGKGVFIAAFALYNEDKPQIAIKILDDLIQCLNEHNLQQHQRIQPQQQQPQQRPRGKGGSSKSRKGGNSGSKINSDGGNSVLCKCHNDVIVVTRLLELRSQCHMALGQIAIGHQALDEFKKARRDMTTAIELNGPVEQRMVRALIVFPAGLEESGWKDSSVSDLKDFINSTAIELDQCPCFSEYVKLYGRATSDEDDTWNWPHVPTTEDSIVQWSVRAPPAIRRVTSLLLGRKQSKNDDGDYDVIDDDLSFTLDQMIAWSSCDKMHETRYNAFIALSVLLGTNTKSVATGLHMYLMAQLEKQAMVFHQFFDNAMREIHDRNLSSSSSSSSKEGCSSSDAVDSSSSIKCLSWKECVESWYKHWDEYPACYYIKEEFQKSARLMYHKQRPCVVCQKPTVKACSHCHIMPICSDECLSRVWIAHIKSFNSVKQQSHSSSSFS